MEREELTREIGMNIRKLRLKKDISQEALSLSAGLHPSLSRQTGAWGEMPDY